MENWTLVLLGLLVLSGAVGLCFFIHRRLQSRQSQKLELTRREDQHAFAMAVLDGLAESVIACDANGRLTWMNRSARDIHSKAPLGTPPESWPERLHLFEKDGVTPLYWRNVPLYRALNGALLSDMEICVKPPGKPLRYVRVIRAQPLLNPSQRNVGAICIELDITESARLAEGKQRTEGTMERLLRERELRQQFICAMTHDLRNPLSVAKSSLRILRRHPKRNEAAYRLMDRIDRSLDRADHMLTDLLDATLIESGKSMRAEIHQMDLALIARETVEELTAIYGDRFVLDAPESVMGYWARDGMRRLIENLASNAVKHGHERREITVKIEQDQSTTLISVHNAGNAIPPAEREALFEAFKRGVDAVESGRKGWGIGLTVVKGVVDVHQGTVNVESEEGVGTTFSVVIPNDARSVRPGILVADQVMKTDDKKGWRNHVQKDG